MWRSASIIIARSYQRVGTHSARYLKRIVQAVTGRDKYEWSSPYLSPDGNHLAYLFPHEGKMQNGDDVYVLVGTRGEGTSISTQIDRDIVRLAWMPDSKALLIGANDHTTVGLWVQPLDGKPLRLDLGNVCPSWPGWWVDLSVGPRGEIAFAGSEPQRPMELYYLANTTAKPSRLTDFNSQIASLELGRSETIEWTSTDGFHEDGVLRYPPDFSPERCYPLVLFIHGGPPAASHEAFSILPQLMAAQGWLVSNQTIAVATILATSTRLQSPVMREPVQVAT